MRRWLRRRRSNERIWQIVSLVGLLVLVVVVASALSQLFLGRTWGLVPTSGTAMAPTIRPGGMIVCLPLGSRQPVAGDIIVFRPQTYDHDVCRRVVSGGADGFVTKGDGLDQTDQDLGMPLVAREDVHGFVPRIAGRPVWLPGLGILAARPGSRTRLLVALAAALVLVVVPPAREAGRRMSRRRMRAIRSSKAWLYGGAAVICVALTVAGMAWVGGRAHVLLGSAELARERSTADGPVDIVVTPSMGRVAVRNTSPLALLVLAYPEPEGQALVDRRYAVVPAHGSQTFGLVQGTGLGDSGMRLMYAPAVVPGDWLYPLARDWGPALGFVVLSAMQFGLAALALLGLDMAMAGVRR